MRREQWHDRLALGHWFNTLPAALQERLLACAIPRRLGAGQTLFCRGDPPCGLYAVLEGAVRVGAVNQAGKEALLTLVEPPNWFGEIALFDGQPRTHDASAEGPSLLLQLPQAALLTLLQAQPQYWRELALLMSQKLRMAFIALEDLSLLPAAPRLARRLLLIAHNYGEQRGPRRTIPLAQEQLAALVGLSRQTTNQILRDLEDRGILHLGYGEIELLDIDRLAEATRG
ncbi:MAG: Crp/Fnr family transcriptional regulator [Pseudomonas sp.]|uniref:Crp/Fnr family transcriptional regulator n=1 Tax=Pseudomonas sp. TaxID=306 RepID=UPI00339B70D0